jgi:hypothetical protein
VEGTVSDSEASTQEPIDEFEHIYRLIRRLDEMTSRERITWEAARTRTDRITYSGRSATVFLESADRDALPPIVFRLRGPTGAELFSWTTEPNNDDPIERKWSKALHDLYEKAHRQALHVDEVVEEFLQELDEEGKDEDGGEA